MPDFVDETQAQPPEESHEIPLPTGQETAPKRISIWRVLGTVLSLGLLIYLISIQGWDSLTDAFRQLPWYAFWLAFLLTLCSRVCVATRWYFLLRSVKVKMSFWQSLRLTFMGLFASNFLPTTVGGDLVRLAAAMRLRVDTGVSAASLVVDRLVGMAGMSSLAPLGLWIVLRPAASGISATETPAAGLLPALSRLPGVGWATRKLDKVIRSLMSSAVYWLRHPSSLVWSLLATYGHMLFTFLAVALLLDGMHQPLNFWWIAGLWSLNYFITTFIPISINGLGLQELTISQLYTRFGGVSVEAGLVLAVLMRVLPLLASLPGALFLPEILQPAPKRPAVSAPVEAPQNTP